MSPSFVNIRAVIKKVLRAQGTSINQQIEERPGRFELPSNIGFQVAAYLKTNPDSRWTDAINALVTRL
jgi:hypothetical protein